MVEKEKGNDPVIIGVAALFLFMWGVSTVVDVGLEKKEVEKKVYAV